MTYLEEHKQRKLEIIDLLKNAHSFYETLGEEGKCESIEKLIENTEKGTFSIVVVGQFSAGKSTFLNALMGDRILPSFTSETTATINFLKSTKESPTQKPLIEVHYKDGQIVQEETVSLTNIENYVSTNGDNIAQNVDYVNLYLDSPFLDDGVTLVDSPGLNGVLAHHEEITKKQIDSSHASIFMFSASAPGQASDFEILRMLKQRCNSIIIVLNRIDEIKEAEGETVESVIEKLKENYHNQFPQDTLPEIIPVAAYLALVARSSSRMDYNHKYIEDPDEKEELLERSRIKCLESRLMKYLTHGEKTIQELMAPVTRIKEFLEETQKELEEDIQSLNQELDAGTIQEEIDNLEEEIKTVTQSIKDETSDLKSGIEDLIETTKDQIKSSTRELKMQSLAKITSIDDLDEFESDSAYYMNRLTAGFQNCYENAINDMQRRFKLLVRDKFESLTEEVQSRLNKSMAEKYEVHTQTFNLNSDTFSLDLDLDELLEKKSTIMRNLIDADDKIMDAEEKLSVAERNERYKNALEDQLHEDYQRYLNDINTLGGRPMAEKRVAYREHKTGGIWGILKCVAVGNRTKQVPYEYYDTSRQTHYDSEKAEIKERYQKREEELRTKLNSITDTDSSVYSNLLKRAERNKAHLEAELERFEEEYQERVSKEKRKKQRFIKSYLTDRIEDLENSHKTEVLSALDFIHNDMLETAQVVIQGNLSETLKKKSVSLERRKKLLEDSVAEKDKLIAEKQATAKKLLDIMELVDDSINEINLIDKDQIEQEA